MKNPYCFATKLTNKLGCTIEFNIFDQYKEMCIDYKSKSLHLIVLEKQVKLLGTGIKGVIFAPELSLLLFSTNLGLYLKENMIFMKNKAWLKYEEHYHDDFDIICES